MDRLGGHPDICNSLQRRTQSMQQRIRDTLRRDDRTDAAQQVPPSPGMDHDPSATLESSMVLLSVSQEPVDEDTSRISCAAPRDSVEQGVHLSPGEDTARPVVSVAIFLKNTNFIATILAGLLETDDDNTVNLRLDINADTFFPDRVYLKQWKDPDKAGARHIKVKEELESVKCCSIEFSGRLCSDTAGERCTAEKRNDLLGPEPTTEPVTSCLGAPLCYRHRSRRPRALREASPVERQLSYRKATLPRTSADVSRLARRSRSA